MCERDKMPTRGDHRAKREGLAKTASVFLSRCMAFIMALLLTSSCDGIAYGTRAFAYTLNERTDAMATQEADGQDASDAAVIGQSGDDQEAPGEAGEGKPSGGEDSQEDADRAVHEALVGNLPVFLGFTIDGAEAMHEAVAIRLQRRIRTWDEESGAWSAIDETKADDGWEDVIDELTDLPVAVYLSPHEILAHIVDSREDEDGDNDGAAYTFRDLSVQTVTEEGAYLERYEYRAMVTSVDDTREDAGYTNVEFVSNDEKGHTQTYAVHAADTRAKTYDYTLIIPTEAGLFVEGDSPETDEVRIGGRATTIAGTTVPQPVGTSGVEADSGQTEEPATSTASPEKAAKSSEAMENSEQVREPEKPTDVPQVLVAQADGYAVSVDLAGQAKEGYRLEVSPLKVDEEQLAAVEQSLSEELSDGITKQAHVDAKDVVLFDISIRDKDGKSVALDDSVRVSVKAPAKSADNGEADVPEVVHLEGAEATCLDAEPIANIEADGAGTSTNAKTDADVQAFTFETEGFSPFAFVYTVDFEYQGYAWSMPGGGSALLSEVLEQLRVVDFTIDDVADAEFSNAGLVRVETVASPAHDWELTSLKPFTSDETLTLTLANGDSVVIEVTDEGETPHIETRQLDNIDNPDNIRRHLGRVQFFDGDILVGDSSAPDSMVVRAGHEYTMRLEFAENEDDDTNGQLPDDGVMYYLIPEGVYLSPKAFDENRQVTFEIVLDRRHTLEGNTVTWVQNQDGKSYIMIQWNKSDAVNYKLLKASPRTTFMLSFPYTTVEVGDSDSITFSDSAVLSVTPDPTFGIGLEKTANLDPTDKETINYEVTAVADGNAENVTFTDVMGEALTYITLFNENSATAVGTNP